MRSRLLSTTRSLRHAQSRNMLSLPRWFGRRGKIALLHAVQHTYALYRRLYDAMCACLSLACAYSQCRTMRASSHHAYIAIARDCSRQISSSHSCTRCDTVACGRKMQCVYMWLLRPSPATTCTSPSDTDLVCAEPIHCERAHLRNMARLLQPHHHRRGSFWPLRMLESLRRQGNLL